MIVVAAVMEQMRGRQVTPRNVAETPGAATTLHTVQHQHLRERCSALVIRRVRDAVDETFLTPIEICSNNPVYLSPHILKMKRVSGD